MSLSLLLSRLLKETSRPRALLTTIIFFSCMQSPWSVLLAQNIPSAPAPSVKLRPGAGGAFAGLLETARCFSSYPAILRSAEGAATGIWQLTPH